VTAEDRGWSAITIHKARCPLTTVPILSHDEHKAAEAAFRGLPLNPRWSKKAQQVYFGILAVTNGRDILSAAVSDGEMEQETVAA
jgi:hypothetical protein